MKAAFSGKSAGGRIFYTDFGDFRSESGDSSEMRRAPPSLVYIRIDSRVNTLNARGQGMVATWATG